MNEMTVNFVEMTTHEPGRARTAPFLIERVRSAMQRAMMDQSSVNPAVLGIHGMSGKRYRRFINNLVGSLPDARYLEVGSWAGSTLCSAINGNDVRATAIDNWSLFGGPKEAFMANLQTFRTPRAYVNFIENDFRQVDYAQLGPFNVYLFDGPHEKQDQYDGLSMALPALDPTFVLIVDDWNWQAVREGTAEAIAACGLSEHFRLELRTTSADSDPIIGGENGDWHNGYYIGVLEKPAAAA